MKTFVKKDLKYKETKDKLRNEVEVLSKLHHPFINQILDSFETDTHFFIVMEYVCGDLLSFIRKRNKLSESSAKIIFKQIIEGLKYIHKKKIIHRDIKLDNILIDLTNTIKICDFGVSRKIEKGNLIYERCGTPAYIAPEIYAKVGYEGCQCDIWSAGITLYYILSGTLPFRGSNIQELEKIIINGEYEAISDVSNEANDIIKGMLRIDPKKRLTIDEILKHPWLHNVHVEDRYKLNIFTEAEKRILSKYDVDYLNASKNDLIENFSYRNLLIDKNKKKIGGNTKSVIYAPYNSCVNEDSKDEDNINIISYLNKEEKALYEELEINNSCCKFGWRVKQANINYELSNNDDFDNGLMKSIKDDENKNKNEFEKNEDISIKNKTVESIKDYEKVKIDKNILEYIEKNVGYDKKYMIKCLKKNIINYSTATYYLLYKDRMNEQKFCNSSELNNI
jgi:serine/threonine protein kinase